MWPLDHVMHNPFIALAELCVLGGQDCFCLEENVAISVYLFILAGLLGWCWQREKIDWQEPRKFDCQLVQTIFIFCCPLSIFPSCW